MEEALDPRESCWKVHGSRVNGHPEHSPNTLKVMEFLRSFGLKATPTCAMGICCADSYSIDVGFLDGGFYGRTAEYESVRSLLASGELDRDALAEYRLEMAERADEEGAWVRGPRAALFIALGLGLRVPSKFCKAHGLEGVTFEQLAMEARFERFYRTTTFVAFDGERRIEIRIGDHHRTDLDKILDARGAKEWAYVTAWNPRSVEASREGNDAAQERLRQALRAEGIDFLEGMSEPADGSPGEASLLAFIVQERAAAMGRAFVQNAIVVGAMDEPAELLWLHPPGA
ncbi:hypothetical protein AKJ08_3028 [Vulgatibacter incomptus]|uniref:DUF3293 domain-containing protein n=1 Tax=Vulgatibacter incomptus TaxID=1391653 RepID=A0A0K1PGT5_9BACT|nr:hypothetical protein AKJ08_3028 [Vulgatibacter incomptus]